MATSTCKNCKNRYVGCHSECVDYIQFTKDNEERKRKYRESIYSEHQFIGYSNDKYFNLYRAR